MSMGKTTESGESPAEGRAKGNSVLASFFLVQWYPERVPEGRLQFLLRGGVFMLQKALQSPFEGEGKNGDVFFFTIQRERERIPH